VNARERAVELVRAALAGVEAERAYINDLNVYPVPDGDTGTNLALTVRAVLEELEATQADTVSQVAASIVRGSLMGARGNSGVILSQIVRGICEVCGADGSFASAQTKRALREGAQSAYRAVRQPVEGTMLSVIRAMAEAAQDVSDAAPLADLMAHVQAAAEKAVERTPEQLAVLKQNGVVDAGGYGLLVIFRSLAATVSGQATAAVRVSSAAEPSSVAAPPRAVHTGLSAPRVESSPAEVSRYRYCTSLLLKGADVPLAEVENFVAGLGDSALVVGDDRMVKVHVHVDDPGVVLSYAVRHGTISEVEINDMYEQTRQRDERLAGQAASTVVAAVVAGAGNAQLFRDLGAALVIEGGQSMNPSAAQIVEAVSSAPAADVIVLPNNDNVVLTAEQAAAISERQHIFVVPSRSLGAGLAAMVAFDPALDGAANALAMTEAMRHVRSGEITFAVRDSEVDGIRVAQGQAIGLLDNRLVSTGDDLVSVFRHLLGEVAHDEPEVITVLTALNGYGVTPGDLEEVAHEVLPTCEFQFHEGGQPLYPILLAVE